MLNRVTQSAVGLMRSTWDSECNTSAASNLAAWQSSAGKGESSSQGSLTNPDPGVDRTQSWMHSKARALDNAKGGLSTLPSRMSKATSSSQDDFEQFLADSNSEHQPFDVGAPSQSPQTFWPDHNEWSRLSAKVADSTPDWHFFAHEDGAAVVALLSSKGTLLDEEPSGAPYLESCQFESYERLPKHTKQTDPALNLIPLSQEHLFQPMAQQKEANMDLASTELAPPDVIPWLEILDKYHDEVWGDKLAFVQAARLEIEKKREAGHMDPQTLVKGPVFRRLQLLLSHIEHPI